MGQFSGASKFWVKLGRNADSLMLDKGFVFVSFSAKEF